MLSNDLLTLQSRPRARIPLAPSRKSASLGSLGYAKMPQLVSGAARDKQGILLLLIRLSGHSPSQEAKADALIV